MSPGIEVEQLGPLSWRWRITHPRTQTLLLTGSAPSQRSAQRHATRAASHWTTQYGHLLTP